MTKFGVRDNSFNYKNGVLRGSLQVDGTFQGNAKFAEKTDIWYVDKNKTGGAAGDGKTWETAFLTLTAAVAAAGAYDIIYLGKGYYTEAGMITISSTQRGLKIIGTTSGGVSTSNGLSSATSGLDILSIEADDVEIAGITFWCLTDGKSGIIIGNGYDGYSNWIHDCCFITGTADNTLGEYGIKANDTEDCVGTLIENNYFHYLSTAAIAIHATRSTIRNNMIWSTALGIDVQNTAGSRACCAVYDNYLIGKNTASSVGIKLHATEPDAGNVLIANNVVTYFETNITTGKSDEGVVNNGTYGDSATFVKVDNT